MRWYRKMLNQTKEKMTKKTKHLYWIFGLMGNWWLECSSMARETCVQSQFQVIPKTQKWYISRVMWSNPRKGVAPSPTSWCSSYWKGSPLVTLNYGCQIYFTYLLMSRCHSILGQNFSVQPYLCIYIWIYICIYDKNKLKDG